MSQWAGSALRVKSSGRAAVNGPRSDAAMANDASQSRVPVSDLHSVLMLRALGGRMPVPGTRPPMQGGAGTANRTAPPMMPIRERRVSMIRSGFIGFVGFGDKLQ